MDQILERMKGRVAAVDPNGPRRVLGIFQVNVTGTDGKLKSIIIDLKNLKISNGTTEEADVTLDIDEETFLLVANRTMPFKDAEANGKAKVSGNLDLVAQLIDVLK